MTYSDAEQTRSSWENCHKTISHIWVRSDVIPVHSSCTKLFSEWFHFRTTAAINFSLRPKDYPTMTFVLVCWWICHHHCFERLLEWSPHSEVRLISSKSRLVLIQSLLRPRSGGKTDIRYVIIWLYQNHLSLVSRWSNSKQCFSLSTEGYVAILLGFPSEMAL